MPRNLKFVSCAAIAAAASVVPTAMAVPVPDPASSLRSLDIDLEVPGCELEIYGYASVDPVIVTVPVFAPRTLPGVEDAQGPMLRAFVLSETDSGANGCRWIAGWADLTARGIFRSAGEGTLAEASGLGDQGRGMDLSDPTLPRWYLALQVR